MSFSLSPIGVMLAIGLLLPNILFIIFFSPKNIPTKEKVHHLSLAFWKE